MLPGGTREFGKGELESYGQRQLSLMMGMMLILSVNLLFYSVRMAGKGTLRKAKTDLGVLHSNGVCIRAMKILSQPA